MTPYDGPARDPTPGGLSLVAGRWSSLAEWLRRGHRRRARPRARPARSPRRRASPWPRPRRPSRSATVTSRRPTSSGRQGSVLHVGRRAGRPGAHRRRGASWWCAGGVFVLADGRALVHRPEPRAGDRPDRGHRRTDQRGRGTAGRRRHPVGRSARAGLRHPTGRAVRGEVDTRTPEQLRAGARAVRRSGPPRAVPPVVETSTGRKVAVAGLPTTFRVGGWSGTRCSTACAARGADRSVVSCDLVRHRCDQLGAVQGPAPVVFATGR